MLIEFLQDYRGKLTGEQFYRAGEVGEFDEATAERLVADGRAVYAGEREDEDAETLAIPLTAEDLAPAEDAPATEPAPAPRRKALKPARE